MFNIAIYDPSFNNVERLCRNIKNMGFFSSDKIGNIHQYTDIQLLLIAIRERVIDVKYIILYERNYDKVKVRLNTNTNIEVISI